MKRTAAAAESRVEELEGKVANLTRILEDPSLYGSSEGTARAVGLGKELDQARRDLDKALEVWNSLVESTPG